jgi:hypothetical protein
MAQVMSMLRPLRPLATHAGLQSSFCDDLLKDVAIETEVRHQTLQLVVLFPKLSQFPHTSSSRDRNSAD